MTLQYADENVGPSSYKGLKSDELLVTNIWYTLQGEGPQCGMPAVFIRLAGCNRGRKGDMGCSFCDTDFRFAKGTAMTFETILAALLDCSPLYAAKRALCVITGGEPMLQDNLVPFIAYLQQRGFNDIAIESNGDRLAKGYAKNVHDVTLVVSPKCTKHYAAVDLGVLYHASALKFVVSADMGSPYYDVPRSYVLAWTIALRRPVSSIFVSPLNIYARAVREDEVACIFTDGLLDLAATRANYQHAAGLAQQHGFRVSLQTHLFLGAA